MADVIEQIDEIPATEHYTDRAGNYVGKTLTRWVDVKARVMEILKEFEREHKEEGGE